MIVISDGNQGRGLKKEAFTTDLCVIGGGMSGVCAAITAAREGLKVVLIQDRPVLGGNASSEIRLWILGATSHMGNNNRWSREGGVIDEILVENTYRNPEGNPVILDMILLDKVSREGNIKLLLNTNVYEVQKKNQDTIERVTAFCSQNSTQYIVSAPLFCDASGDGIVGFLSGAAFRMGAESKYEFDEQMAPDESYGDLLGHSLYFYSKDTGRPVKFIPPAFALDVTKEIPRFRNFNAAEHGCKLWWVEYGGRLDTVHDTENIKWALWKVIYGVWDYIKNSGKFPESETLTLEWVGMIPGKRESRRFEGDYMLSQRDVVEQRLHDDAVAYGGWSIDLHPADGVFSQRDPCNQWHSKGVFQIPYRCLYSKNIRNLFLAGRIASVSHVAFGATRVMATSAYTAQAVAIAALLCHRHGLNPKELYEGGYITELQTELMKCGQFIPGQILKDKEDLVLQATLTASSSLKFIGFDRSGLQWKRLSISAAELLPFSAGKAPVISIPVRSVKQTTVDVRLYASSKPGNFTPDVLLAEKHISKEAGEHELEIDFDIYLDQEMYVFIAFMQNPDIELAYSAQRISGMMSVFNGVNKKVSNFGQQNAPEHSGVDSFAFWCPQRRPEGQNLAIKLSGALSLFDVDNIRNGVDRPALSVNAWVADPGDVRPEICLSWEDEQDIKRIDLCFDTDFDHAMESVLMTHPETVMPFCVRDFYLEDGDGNRFFEKVGNYQTRNIIKLPDVVKTKKLRIGLLHPSIDVPASVFAVRCYRD